jgi:hypothetical protein
MYEVHEGNWTAKQAFVPFELKKTIKIEENVT